MCHPWDAGAGTHPYLGCTGNRDRQNLATPGRRRGSSAARGARRKPNASTQGPGRRRRQPEAPPGSKPDLVLALMRRPDPRKGPCRTGSEEHDLYCFLTVSVRAGNEALRCERGCLRALAGSSGATCRSSLSRSSSGGVDVCSNQFSPSLATPSPVTNGNDGQLSSDRSSKPTHQPRRRLIPLSRHHCGILTHAGRRWPA